MAKDLGIHETLELHELLVFKNTCLTKSTTLGGMAQDNELKQILSADATASKSEIQQLQRFLS
ncbi:hypothetical protein CU633_16515 [Bacillus sp. V3-13]|uniref:hypothetical protein n=1 Tax=Bacillus sp. V3-13 TaxID=2053728 RepID=UPI000C7707EF|nr:hypothetical protein [Bacillus sp. V3-13]PLR76298.1 hypothetical protein CU633_16515 [Bacillus sp. V3-13]